ncbi:MAG: hypothetical protein JWN13_4033, partial [Betaproteobacteria bacterium]|nr:hypothetical protein [Betaproteobacteria bacterium]
MYQTARLTLLKKDTTAWFARPGDDVRFDPGLTWASA